MILATLIKLYYNKVRIRVDDMREKGFTLIELLGVLILLGLLAIISVIGITSSVNSSREKAYNHALGIIESACLNWTADNISRLPSNENSSITVTLSTLKNGNYIDENLKNPMTGENFPDNVYVLITFKDGDYTYKVVAE